MFEDLGITPISPHSDTLIMTAFSDYYYRMFRMAKFDPNGMGDKAELEQTIERATKIGKSAVQLKEITANETAAFKAYVPPLASIASTLMTNDIMHENVPACAANTTKVPGDGTTHLLSIDEKKTIEGELDDARFLSLPGLEDMVSYFVTASIDIETPDEVQELPGSRLYMYIPFMTIGDIRTALATLLANQHLFSSYCDKLGIPTVQWSSSKVVSKRMPTMQKFDWNNKSFQFWAFNGWLWHKNATADQFILQADNGQGLAEASVAAHLTYKHYIYRKGEKPNSYNNIVRMAYPEHADNNEMGCSELVQASTLAGLDAIADGDFNVVCAAVNGTTLDWITLGGAGKLAENIITLFPGILADNGTLGLDKEVDQAPQSVTVKEECLIPGDFKIRAFGGVTGFWDITNYNAEIMFFSRVFGQAPKGPGTKKEKKYVKGKKPRIDKVQSRAKPYEERNIIRKKDE
jgi:hypothetical protein